MPKFRIEVTKGIAAVYPHGMNAKGFRTLIEGDTIEGEVGPRPSQPIAHGALLDQANADLDAPAAGVATGASYGSRDGTLRVTAIDGPIKVRVYVGADFSEQKLEAGEQTGLIEVIESNRITLAIYPA